MVKSLLNPQKMLFQTLSTEIHLYHDKNQEVLLVDSCNHFLAYSASILLSRGIKVSDLVDASIAISMNGKLDRRLTTVFNDIYFCISGKKISTKPMHVALYEYSLKVEDFITELYFGGQINPRNQHPNSKVSSDKVSMYEPSCPVLDWEINELEPSENHDLIVPSMSETLKFDGEESLFIKEMNKLSISSSFVISNETKYDPLQRYLHIERIVQSDFHKSLLDHINTSKSSLILLCGNVGDGKSHLLSYFNDSFPEISSKFTIINDATESMKPDFSAMETLKEKLKCFSSENHDYSNEKIVVAINLGILKNFLDYNGIKDEFSELFGFVEKSKVFEDSYVKNFSEDIYTLINIGSYGFFDVEDEIVGSKYIDNVLEKFVDHSKENPFYNAYQMDLNAKLQIAPLFNYRLLFSQKTRDCIRNLLVRTYIDCNQIVSMRSILNFLRSIIVSDSMISSLNSLLFNLLFTSKNDDSLVSIVSKFDPIKTKNKEVDDLLLNLYLAESTDELFNSNSSLDSYESTYLFKLLNESTLIEKEKTLLRLISISPSLASEKYLTDSIYLKYLSELAHFCIKKKPSQDLFKLVKTGMRRWNGYIEKDELIYVNQTKTPIKLLQKFSIQNKVTAYCGDFTRVIGMTFTIGGEECNVEIDYELYSLLRKIDKGYFPNKTDKEAAIQFDRFCSKVQDSGGKYKELYIQNTYNDQMYKLEYDSDFETYVFERKN